MVDKLDIEDDEHRQRRIQNLLESLNASSTTRPEPPLPTFDFGDRTTFPVPPSALLARVQDFLPQLQAANEALAQQQQENPDAIDIENVPDDAPQYIEMNLGLGVYEDRSKRTESSSDEGDSDTDMSSAESEDEDEDSSEGDSEEDTSSQMDIISSLLRPVKPLPKRGNRRPEIIVLDEKPEPSSSTGDQ